MDARENAKQEFLGGRANLTKELVSLNHCRTFLTKVLVRGCQWGIALVSKQLKKSQLVSKLLKKVALVSKQQKRRLNSKFV